MTIVYVETLKEAIKTKQTLLELISELIKVAEYRSKYNSLVFPYNNEHLEIEIE